MVYKITIKTILIQLVGVGVMLVATMLGVGYLVVFKDADVGGSLFFMGCLAIVFSVDSIVLFVRYYLINKDSVVEFLSSDWMRWSQGGVETYISPDDVESIDLNLTYPVFDERIGWGGGDNFIYAKFNLKDGRSFVLTSLMSPKLDLPQGFYQKAVRVRNFRCWL